MESFTDVDAYFVESEADLVLSPRVLYEVIDHLQLPDPDSGEPLRSNLQNVDRICRHLKRRIQVTRTPDSCVLGIEVTWGSGNEAPKIANAIVTTYTKMANRLGWRTISFEIEEAKSNLKECDQMLNSQKERVSHFQSSVGASRADRLRYFFERGYLNGLLRRREAVSNHIDDLQSEYTRARAHAYETQADLADLPRSPAWAKDRLALFCVASGLILSFVGAWKIKHSQRDTKNHPVKTLDSNKLVEDQNQG
jgi:uncharacterized protein involved in exopolysaccharide biosynthesis